MRGQQCVQIALFFRDSSIQLSQLLLETGVDVGVDGHQIRWIAAQEHQSPILRRPLVVRLDDFLQTTTLMVFPQGCVTQLRRFGVSAGEGFQRVQIAWLRAVKHLTDVPTRHSERTVDKG